MFSHFFIQEQNYLINIESIFKFYFVLDIFFKFQIMQKKTTQIKKGQSLQKPTFKSNNTNVTTTNQIPKEETKKGFTVFPSSKYTNIKTVDPFADKKGNSFAHIYSAGSIPCKINHGSVSMKLQWNKDVVIAQLPYDPLLVSCFQGLIEQAHPYSFIAYNCIKDMILQESSSQKLIALLPKLVWPLRTALASKKQQIAERALDTLKMLSDKVGSHLNSNVKNVVAPIVKHIGNKKLKDKVYLALQALQENGGPEVFKIIKSTIPTYSNV